MDLERRRSPAYLADAGGSEITALLGGPTVATCFQCDSELHISFTYWHGEFSKGRVVALLPYCESCLGRRPRRKPCGCD